MTLDVETPDPPTLSGAQDPGDYDAVDEPEDTGDDYRREALAEFLDAGAWADAFDDWADRTYLSEAEFGAVLDADLIDELDFFWNPSAEDVGYRAPTVPTDLPTPPDLDRDDIRVIEEELDDLARTASEVLENDYIHRSSEEFGYDWE